MPHIIQQRLLNYVGHRLIRLNLDEECARRSVFPERNSADRCLRETRGDDTIKRESCSVIVLDVNTADLQPLDKDIIDKVGR